MDITKSDDVDMTKATNAAPVTKPKGRIRWIVLGLLCLLALINNIDRLALSVAAPAMQADLGLTATDIGLLGSAFALFYAIGQLPSGWLIDRYGTRLLGGAVVLWSLATAAMGMFNKMGWFVLARAWLGLAEAPSLLATNKIVTHWFPKKEQGIANASWDAALKAGPAFFTGILVWIVAAFGWRTLFFIAGIAGIVFAVLFLLSYRNPDDHPRLTTEERDYIRQDRDSNSPKTDHVPWGALFTRPTMWGMMAGYFCNMWVYQIFLTFIPLFVINEFGIEFKSMGLIVSVPWIGAIIGDLTSGVLSKRLSERAGWTTKKAKMRVITVSLAFQAGLVALIPLHGAGMSNSTGLAFTITLMAFALGFNGAVVAHAWSMAAEVTTTETVASVASLQNFGGFLGATVSPLVAGIIIDATDSFNLVFFSAGIVGVLSLAFYHFGVRRPIITATSHQEAA
ncbi:MFS transporter [Rhodococcus sp. NPDC057529]|uniref:MFS transporter n=1 Tax=Rhodococcus sp. NPDC057529 TaxID=3346158 RepID=UPI00366AE123